MSNINFFSISSLLILALASVVAVFSFLKGEDRKLNVIWGLFCVSGAIWGLGSFKFSTTISKESAFFWWQIAYIGVILSPVFYSHFVYELLKIETKRLSFFYCFAFIFLGFNFIKKNLFLGDLKFVFNQFYFLDWTLRHSLVMLIFYILFYCILLFHTIFLLFSHYRSSSGLKRLQLKYLIIASIIGWWGPHSSFFISFGFNTYPPINFLLSIFAIIVIYLIIRFQFLDINLIFQKSFIYSILIALITATYFIFVFLAEKLFQGMVGYTSLAISILYAFIIALFFNPVKNKLQHIADKIFLGKDPMQIARENELMRQELERAERLKAVAHFASGMAHEIKNPLTAIKTFAEYLPEKKNDPEFLNKFSKIVSGEVGRIDSLVHQLLDFSKPSPLKLQEVDIHQLLDDTLNLLNNDFIRHRIKVVKEYQATGSRLQVDSNKLKQAFLNLFLNAIEAMPNGGILTVETSVQVAKGPSDQVDSTTRPLDHLTTRPLNHLITISISDTGCGIPEKNLPHIFEPFYSTKEDGTGLGLSIVYNIIKEHSGSVKVESKINQGTRFIIELPLTKI